MEVNNDQKDTETTHEPRASPFYARRKTWSHKHIHRRAVSYMGHIRRLVTLTFFVSFATLLTIFGCVCLYKLFLELFTYRPSIRTTVIKHGENLVPPGVIIFPIGANFEACGHYYNVIASTKAHLRDVHSRAKHCKWDRYEYDDPLKMAKYKIKVIVFEGPGNYTNREALFVHFKLPFVKRDFMMMNYMLFYNYSNFQSKSPEDKIKMLQKLHVYCPSFSLSAGFRQWIKFKTYIAQIDNDNKNKKDWDVEFITEQSVIKYWDKRSYRKRDTQPFFTFFEWKTDIVTESKLVYTTSVWSVIAALCSIFLTLHKAYQIGSVSFQKLKAEKKRRVVNKVMKKREKETEEMSTSDSLRHRKVQCDDHDEKLSSDISDSDENNSTTVEVTHHHCTDDQDYDDVSPDVSDDHNGQQPSSCLKNENEVVTAPSLFHRLSVLAKR